MSEGYIDLGPLEMEVGDAVCIFFRWKASVCFETCTFVSPRVYRLLGDAYVHDVMDGQLMEKKPEIETLEIC